MSRETDRPHRALEKAFAAGFVAAGPCDPFEAERKAKLYAAALAAPPQEGERQPPKPGEPMRMACVGCGRDVPDSSTRCPCGSWHYRWEPAAAPTPDREALRERIVDIIQHEVEGAWGAADRILDLLALPGGHLSDDAGDLVERLRDEPKGDHLPDGSMRCIKCWREPCCCGVPTLYRDASEALRMEAADTIAHLASALPGGREREPAVGFVAARKIPDDSWLHEERFRWFREGYAYASTQTRAIPGLAAVDPHDLYSAVWAIMRGAQMPDPEAAAPQASADTTRNTEAE
jgi:hypothetical protein